MDEAAEQEKDPLLDKSFDDLDLEDTETLSAWMKLHITRPPKGYNAKTHEDGTPLTEREQIDNFIKQNVDVIEHNKLKKFPIERYRGAIRAAILPFTSERTGPSSSHQTS